jgi:hypothetical protein
MKEELVKSTVNSIEFFLNPKIPGDGALARQIGDRLMNGDLIVIREALQPSFAERMFACLDQFPDWKVYKGYEEHFHYHHHNIYDDKLFPPDLVWCSQIFNSEATKNFIQGLSQTDCGGETTFSASLYLPGDYSLPHDDFLGPKDHHRQVAFVWYLTKDWQSEWGGELFWCRKNRYISPSFNSLLLFRVQPANMHFVTVVSPHAQSKRLAISGWWTGKTETAVDAASAADQGTDEKQLVKII